MRLTSLEMEDFTEEQLACYGRMVRGPRPSVAGPLWAWLRVPPLADVAQEYGAYCRFRTKLDRRLAELTILVIAAHWKAGFEWAVHAAPAHEEGLSTEQIECIRTGKIPYFDREEDRAVYDYCIELLGKRAVTNTTYATLVGAIGEKGAVEIVGLTGYYLLVAVSIITFDLPCPNGIADPFADLRD